MKVHKDTIYAKSIDYFIEFLKGAGLGIAACLIFEYNFVYKIAIIYIVITFLFFLINALLSPLSYESYSYCVNGLFIKVKRGVLIKSEKDIPLKRMQHIELNQTIGSRMLKKHSVVIHTSGGSTSISFLSLEEARELRETLLEVVEKDELELYEGFSSSKEQVASNEH